MPNKKNKGFRRIRPNVTSPKAPNCAAKRKQWTDAQMLCLDDPATREEENQSVVGEIGSLEKPEFTLEEKLLFQRRLDEGYDLNDPRYDLWLHQGQNNSVSATSSVIVPSPVTMASAPLASSPTSIPACVSTSTTPSHSPFADHLKIPLTPLAPKKHRTGRARVLTSSECWALLKQKEEKKQKEAEEKEKRKQEREEKRKKKEEKKQKEAKRQSEKLRKEKEKSS